MILKTQNMCAMQPSIQTQDSQQNTMTSTPALRVQSGLLKQQRKWDNWSKATWTLQLKAQYNVLHPLNEIPEGHKSMYLCIVAAD